MAAILRAVLTHETKKLYNAIIGYSRFTRNYCTHRPVTMLPGKEKGSGLGRVAAHPKPPKQHKPSASGTSFTDRIVGTCFADTLQVSFPAHRAPVVLQQLQQKEDNYRVENPSWMDQEVVSAHIRKQWQEARANRRVQFKVGKNRDGSWESNIRVLTGTIKVDRIRCTSYVAAGVIAGVFW